MSDARQTPASSGEAQRNTPPSDAAMTDESAEIVQRVLEGSVAIQFDLASTDITTVSKPESFFCLARTGALLPVYAQELRDHFKAFAADTEATVWFDFEGHALPWHVPLGLLRDVVEAKFGSAHESLVPWRIVCHFSGYPSDKLIEWRTETDVLSMFANTLKESTYLAYGTVKPVMDMTQSEQSRMWDGVRHGDSAVVTEIKNQLRAKAKEYSKRPPRLAFRIYWDDLYHSNVPCIPRESCPVDIATLINKCATIPVENISACRILCNGVTIPGETSPLWIMDHLTMADGFVYLVIVPTTT